METIVLATTGTLPRLVVIKSNYYSGKGYAHYDNDGSVLVGEPSVFSVTVKIEAERATRNASYVNLRFCQSNKYWERKGGKFIVAESNKPEEDITKPSCTLFEPVSVAGGNGLFYLKHVQSGGRVLIDEASMRFFVEQNPNPEQGYLSSVNWNTLVKLPKNVAFRGYNESYLGGLVLEGYNYLRFSFNDPNSRACGQEIHLMDDGYLQIKSKEFNKFWRRSPNWIYGDSTDTTPNNKNTLFWPVKIDETTIALRNAGNNNFCEALTTEGKTNCLNAAVGTITTEARLVVKELVLGRRIYNVRYWMENSRIYNEKAFVAGTTTAVNNSDQEAGIAVEVSYEDERSYSFSHSYSLTLGTTVTITAGIPGIAGSEVEVGVETTASMQWDKTTSKKVGVKATGSVPVPPRSVATVSYVGTTGTCDVPFAYTQEDSSSTDGQIIVSEHVDGVFNGVNTYNYSFVIEIVKPL